MRMLILGHARYNGSAMKSYLLNHTLLHVPLLTWILQLLYVALALTILYTFVVVHKRQPWEIMLFVAAVIVVDVAWRLAIR